MMLDQTIGFLGCGQMARALAQGFVQANLSEPARLIGYDPHLPAGQQLQSELPGARLAESNAAVVQSADVILLAVKPQHVAGVAKQVGAALPANKLLVSIAAGVSLDTLCRHFGTERIVRVMPNTPCLVGQGAAGFALAAGASEDDSRLVEQLLRAVGIAFPLDESLLDAVTGLSGSGPAYVYIMIEALSDGGVRMGLPRAVATALAAQTVRGAAEMVLRTELHPSVLKDRVASPGGTTITALQTLEDRALRGALMAAVEAATQRSRELGQGK